MSEETKAQVEELESEELDLDELEQVSGGAMNRVRVSKTKDITQSMKDRV